MRFRIRTAPTVGAGPDQPPPAGARDVTALPSFALSSPAGTLVGGIKTGYGDVAQAAAALRDGAAEIVVGGTAVRPSRPSRSAPADAPVPGAADPMPTPLPTVRIAGTLPDPDVHRMRVEAALGRLTDPENPLQKVVLARALRLVSDTPLDPMAILNRLRAADPEACGYLVDLSPAGGGFTGRFLLGASPELFVARRGDQVICQPFAGSAPRSDDPAVDAANGAALAGSSKNRHEHQLVVDTMRAGLEPLCSHLEVAGEPQLSSTAALWHLSTPIRGTLRENSTTALDLVLALHPTPAVGGCRRRQRWT